MKIITLIALLALTCIARAQDGISKEEWNREYTESWALTSLLFPEMNDTDSAIYRKYKSILPTSQNYPRLAHGTYLPLFHAIHAARALGVAPRWSALNDAQKQEVVDEIASYSTLLIQTIGDQNQQLAVAYNSRAPVDTSFNPAALEGPEARRIFNPQPQPGVQPSTAPAVSTPQTVFINNPDGTTSTAIVTP